MAPHSLSGAQTQVVQGAFGPQGHRGPAEAVQRLANGEAFQLPANLSHFGRGAGQPLPQAVLQKMESFFGAKFGDVRVHVGQQAPAIGALAFTHGSNLFFAPGQYHPTTHRGQEILAHELTHVVQQRTGRVRNPFGSGIAVIQDRGMEAEAERMGRQAAAHKAPVQMTPGPASLPSHRSVPGKVPATVQPLSFARFSTYGWFSNYGRYNWREEDLLALVLEVSAFHEGLHRLVKDRRKVISLKRQLGRIERSTIAEHQYATTKIALNRIKSELDRERRNQYLLERGYPESPILVNVSDPEVDEAAWSSIVHGVSKKRRKQLRLGKTPDGLVRNLFRSFCNQDFQYNIMATSVTGLLSKSRGDTPEGNCLALARGFAEVLDAYNIKAEAKHVRDETQGRFIVRLGDFIDPRVRGHIYYQNSLQVGYFMFTHHAATWVPSEGRFYDPMAKASYTQTTFNGLVECELEEDRNGAVFTPKGSPKTLQPTFKWRLVKKDKVLPGNFNQMELRPVEKKRKKRY